MAHHHQHTSITSNKVGRNLVIGVILNLLFVLVEGGVGFWQGSLSLLADAGHNLSDVSSLALALLAFRLIKKKPNNQLTYGYRKSTILVALANAVILLIAIGGIGYEAVQRILHPEPLEGGMIAIVAGVGILINGFTAYLFLQDKDKDLNIKGAYLHMVADTLVSVGVVIAGLLIMWTGWYLLDPIISFGIMIVILVGTWGLLKDSLHLSLDGVPKGIDIEKVKKVGYQALGVIEMHHIHIWAMSTTENAMTAHLVVPTETPLTKVEVIKNELKEKLLDLNIHHCTFEVEIRAKDCPEDSCEVTKKKPETHFH